MAARSAASRSPPDLWRRRRWASVTQKGSPRQGVLRPTRGQRQVYPAVGISTPAAASSAGCPPRRRSDVVTVTVSDTAGTITRAILPLVVLPGSNHTAGHLQRHSGRGPGDRRKHRDRHRITPRRRQRRAVRRGGRHRPYRHLRHQPLGHRPRRHAWGRCRHHRDQPRRNQRHRHYRPLHLRSIPDRAGHQQPVRDRGRTRRGAVVHQLLPTTPSGGSPPPAS